MEIKRKGSQALQAGAQETFTGKVSIEPLFRGEPPARALVLQVTFEPGARSAWHTHPLGQLLFVTAGHGLTQIWGGPVEEIHAGDTILTPPGEKHWHGASEEGSMTHLAIQEMLEGRAVDWLEKVNDAQYGHRARQR